MEDEFVSLFNYLGTPAGPGLGYRVAAAAKKVGEPVQVKHIENNNYKGPINMFRREFLNQYFNH
jgi:hypothetical protein